MAGASAVLTRGSLIDDAALAVHVLSAGAAPALLFTLGGKNTEGEHWGKFIRKSCKYLKSAVAAWLCTLQLAFDLAT